MTATGAEMTKTVDPELARKLRERLETELIPKLQNQKIRTRTAVAVTIIALVDRQIGHGEGQLDGEWDKLREMTKDQPKALKLVDDLKVVIDNYDQELRTKSAESEADEEAMRKAANALIRGAIMAKLKALQELDREEDAREAAAAKERTGGEEPSEG
jgi:siroheme synthase (precorrin-2 oxidase/ferrochelatase)